MKKISFCFFFFLLSELCSVENSVFLMNDSPFKLRASVQSADGTYLGGIKLEPGEQKQWTKTFKPSELNIPGEPEASLTPFTVIWRCDQGDFFSMCTDASPGALIRATICPGSHYCAPKEHEQECPPCECIFPEGDSEQD